MKIKENEKRDKFLDLARELRKLWNTSVTLIIITIGALGTVSNGLARGGVKSWKSEDESQTLQTLLRLAGILKNALET